MCLSVNISPLVEVQKKRMRGEQMVVLKAVISAGFLIQQRRKEPTAAAPHPPALAAVFCHVSQKPLQWALGELKTAKPSILKKK